MAGRSVFAGLAQDEFARARAIDARYQAGKAETVQYVSDFSEGFDNWTDMWVSYRPYPPISLTSHAAVFGSRSLMLSTTEGTYDAGAWGNGALAFRRLTRPRLDSDTTDHMRYMSVSAWLALGVGGFDSSWGQFSLMIDTNKYDDSSRNFFRLMCDIQAYPDGSRWAASTSGDGTVYTVIPGSTGIWHGDNDNKVNFGYVRLTIDRLANAGAGGYHEAQIGPHVFDLAALGLGSVQEPLQDAGTNITRFSGGDNIGLALGRNAAGVAGGCQLFADGVAVSVSDQA